MSISHIREPSKYVTPSITVFFALIFETNLSKNKSYLTESISVTPKRYKIKLPAADPRPNPTGMSLELQK